MSGTIPPAASAAITKAGEIAATAAHTADTVAKTADDVAKAATTAAATTSKTTGMLASVATAVGAAAGPPGSPGRLTMWAGVTGIGLTLFNTVRDGFFKDQDLNQLGLGPTSLMIGGGLLMLSVAGKQTGRMGEALRYGAMAPIGGGVIGATMATLGLLEPASLGGPQDDGRTNSSPFSNVVPSTMDELRGARIANADVRIKKQPNAKDMPVYLDPSTAVKVEGGTFDAALDAARKAVRDDKDAAGVFQFRSQAIVQTADGAYWIARLTGDLDQIDGPNYAVGNEHDSLFLPRFGFVQAGVKALVGVDGVHQPDQNPDPRTDPDPVVPDDPNPLPNPPSEPKGDN